MNMIFTFLVVLVVVLSISAFGGGSMPGGWSKADVTVEITRSTDAHRDR